MDRSTFEEWYSKCRGRTPGEMGRLGWISAPCVCNDPDCVGWTATCVPPDASPEIRKRALSGMVGYATFGQTPPTAGGA